MNPIGRRPVVGGDDRMPIFINPLYFPMSIFTVLMVYLPVLLPLQVSGTVTPIGWNIVSMVFCFIVTFVVYIGFYTFSRNVVNNETQYSTLGILYGIIDSMFSLFHALGCMVLLIMLFRGSTTVDFSGSAGLGAARGYDLFWTYCLANSVGFFSSSGSANIIPTSGWGTFWQMTSSITGMIAMGVILATATSRLRRVKRIPVQESVRTYYRQENRIK